MKKHNWNNEEMKLVQLNGSGFAEKEIEEGDEVVTNDGEVWVVSQGVGRPPHKPGSTGRVWVTEPVKGWSQEFFPGVFGLLWVMS